MEGHSGNKDLYKECLRNHAASLGSYATDGCGEFTTGEEGRLQCAACGCHRNFHRKVSYCGSSRAGELERSGGGGGGTSSSKKRMRTKFTAEQKEKMLGFAEKLGWKLMRIRDEEEDEVEKFCRGIGVTRQVFKVWMHNHKTTTSINSHYSSAANASSLTTDL